MAEPVTHATVRAMYAAYSSGDAAAFAAMLHDDIDWAIYAPVQLFSFAGVRRGRDAVLKSLAGLAETYQLEKLETEVIIAEGDRAAVLADMAFLQKASGRTLRFRVADFIRLKDGKIIEFRQFSNSFDLVEQALGREIDFPL